MDTPSAALEPLHFELSPRSFFPFSAKSFRQPSPVASERKSIGCGIPGCLTVKDSGQTKECARRHHGRHQWAQRFKLFEDMVPQAHPPVGKHWSALSCNATRVCILSECFPMTILWAPIALPGDKCHSIYQHQKTSILDRKREKGLCTSYPLYIAHAIKNIEHVNNRIQQRNRPLMLKFSPKSADVGGFVKVPNACMHPS